MQANCLGYAAEYEAALSESRALKRSVRAKRAEIDSLQSVINKVKNAMSVEDIDTRVFISLSIYKYHTWHFCTPTHTFMSKSVNVRTQAAAHTHHCR